MTRRNRRKPIRDPLLRAIKPTAEPPPEEVRKDDGRPPASQTLRAEAGHGRPAPSRSLLHQLGPGLITGASDDDPSGIGTYAQVGSQFGFGLLWTALFTLPLMAAVQELCARIALETGVGLGVSLRRKFPTFVVGVAILGLLIANTINVGADLGAVAAGGSLLSRGSVPTLWLVVPVAVGILALELFTTYTTIFRTFKWLTLALLAYVVTAFFVHPPFLNVLWATVVPHVELRRDFVTSLVAVLGTTISPYLFFWQASSEVDQLEAAGEKTGAARRGVSKGALRAARTDVVIGMAFSQVVMYFIILTSGAVLHVHGGTEIQTADQAAAALAPLAGPFAYVLFAIGLIGAGLLAIPILAGSAAYALKEFFGLEGSLASRPRYRPTFYLILSLATMAGVVMNFLHLDPIRALFWTAVINGVVAPPLLVLIVLLGADRKVMKSRVSGGLSLLLTSITTIVMALTATAMIVTLIVR